jgi:phosphate-selective porin
MLVRFERLSRHTSHTIGSSLAPSQTPAGRRRASAALGIAAIIARSALVLTALASSASAQQTTAPTAATAGTAPASAQRRTGAPRPEPGPVRWNNRPALVFGNATRVELRARLQSDVWLRDDSNPDSADVPLSERLTIPRRRVGVVGEIGGRIAFQIEREVSGASPWRDAYADVRLRPSFWLRAGHFKVPFSLEQLASVYDLPFVWRAAAVSDLAPGRELGVMAHGRFANRALEYEAGVFRADRSLRLLQAEPGRSLAGRVTIAPLRDGRRRGSRDLRVSIAMLHSEAAEGRSGANGHLAMGDVFFARMFVNGRRQRLGLSTEWTAGPTSVQGEWIRSAEARRGQAIGGGDLSDLLSQGGYASLTVRVINAKNRRGDLDLGVRYDQLSFGSANRTDEPFLNPRAEHVAPIGRNAVTFGATLFASRWVKVQANTIQERRVDPLNLRSLAAPTWSTVVRAQVSM